MDQPKNDKSFDCVAYKRRIQLKIYEEIRQLSPQEQILYFHTAAKTGPLGAWWTQLSATRRTKAGS